MLDIVLDFDGTVTAKDTIGALGLFGVSHQAQKNPSAATTNSTPDDGDGRRQLVDHAAAWDHVVASYVADHRQHVAAYSPREADRTTLEAEAAFQASLAQLDARSLERLAASGVFCGVTEQHLFAAGQAAVRSSDVPVRRGFSAFASAAGARGARLSIISVNWSTAFIRGVVAQCCGGGNVVADVISNEITPDGRVAAGRGRVTTAEANESEAGHKLPPQDLERRVVYFGDSPTDLECLLAASAGVVIADSQDSSALLRTLSRLGFAVPHVSESTAGRSDNGRHSLVWARDFHEVLDSGFLDALLQPPDGETDAREGK